MKLLFAGQNLTATCLEFGNKQENPSDHPQNQEEVINKTHSISQDYHVKVLDHTVT